jgi:A/G-specific adenine glycosylase
MPAARKPAQSDSSIGRSGSRQRSVSARLLAWYDVHRRVLPWRAPVGKRADPYRVWLSEIMLQQTTVQAVAAYYAKFLSLWPDVKALAKAPQDDVLAAWAGLGYYARARNLHAAAQVVANEMGGKFPTSYETLRTLPGVGGYTAAAIAAIAYDEKQAAMDANAERVIARLFAVQTPLPKGKKEMHARCQALVPERAGDFAQALMDLGSAICTPKRPACPNCPLFADCKARKLGIQELLPVKAPKMVRPLKRGAAFVVRDASGAVLLVKRPDKGLLASMLEPPLGPWAEEFPSGARAPKQAPFEAKWKTRPGIVRHGFTHFELEIEVYTAEIKSHPPLEGGSKMPEVFSVRGRKAATNPSPKNPRAAHANFSASPSRGEAKWVPTDKLRAVALPTVMRKIVEHGLDGL